MGEVIKKNGTRLAGEVPGNGVFRIVFGVSGASGMPLARTVLEIYATIPEIEIHLVISDAACQTLAAESGLDAGELEKHAFAAYSPASFAATLASGTWPCAGMIICPCSMSTLAAIASGCGTNLIHRAADVALKESRPLILATRETPLNRIHLKNMLTAHDAGATIMPFVPAFYAGDNSLQGAMRQFAGRMLDQLGINNSICARWRGCPLPHPQQY